MTNNKVPGFAPPRKTLEESLGGAESGAPGTSGSTSVEADEASRSEPDDYDLDLNITDEEKEQRLAQSSQGKFMSHRMCKLHKRGKVVNKIMKMIT